MVSTSDSSYRAILKGLATLSGVQIFQMIISLLRGKVVALLLGSAGMGISSLFLSASVSVQQVCGCGINLSVVKAIAEAGGDVTRIATVIRTCRRLSFLAGIVGALVMILLSHRLSLLTFGDTSSATGFMMMGAMVFFALLAAGEFAILQGLHLIRRLSSATTIGAACGLAASIPLYYFLRNDGIVPALVLSSFMLYVVYRIQVRRSTRHLVRSDIKVGFRTMSRKLLSVGIVLMSSTVVSAFIAYVINAVVREYGSLSDVGFYQAANSVAVQYIAVIFAALSFDYFPRISALSDDLPALHAAVNRQTGVVMLVTIPLALLLGVFAPLVVRILFSEAFLPIVPLLRWMALGIVFKALAYPIGYMLFAVNNPRLFLLTETIGANLIDLAAMLGGFMLFGLEGLGIGFCASHLLAFMLYYTVNRLHYGFRLTVFKHFLKGMCGFLGRLW